MRFAYSVQQKIRIAVLLFAVMACSILIRLLEDRSVASLNSAFVSMYNDRLIPAADLFYIAEQAHAKKSGLEKALYGVVPSGQVSTMAKFDANVDSLLGKYEKTYLVKSEKSQLEVLNKALAQSRGLEAKIADLIGTGNLAGARALYEQRGRRAAETTIAQLSGLMAIQRQVGQELIKDSEFTISGSKMYSSLQTALAIVIGILIVGIVFTSNVVRIRNDKFHLN